MKRRTLLKEAGKTGILLGSAGVVGGAETTERDVEGGLTPEDHDECVVQCCCNCPSTCARCECDFCCF